MRASSCCSCLQAAHVLARHAAGLLAQAQALLQLHQLELPKACCAASASSLRSCARRSCKPRHPVFPEGWCRASYCAALYVLNPVVQYCFDNLRGNLAAWNVITPVLQRLQNLRVVGCSMQGGKDGDLFQLVGLLHAVQGCGVVHGRGLIGLPPLLSHALRLAVALCCGRLHGR